jgi:4-diphosphocytidyl-2-C-methyl-D-erythritol kinase
LSNSDGLEEAARAKVNLALHVVGRRKDGYHLLDSLVLFADLADRLQIAPAGETAMQITGPLSAGIDRKDNLVLRAHAAMQHAFGSLVPNIDVTLEKNIPVAAGLGGGSADAAATLRALCRLAGLDPLSRQLHEIALTLGADVPVCLHSRASRLSGIGEAIEPIADFSPLHVVLVNAGTPVPTAEVYARLGLEPGEPGYPPMEFPFAFSTSRSDLTPPALELVPEIGVVLQQLKELAGVRFARMSGSGGTCFAVFDDVHGAEAAAAVLAGDHPTWWVRATLLE